MLNVESWLGHFFCVWRSSQLTYFPLLAHVPQGRSQHPHTSWSSREHHTSRASTVLTSHCNLVLTCDSLLLPSLTGSTGVGQASLFQRPLPVVTVFCRCHDYISRGCHSTGLNFQTSAWPRLTPTGYLDAGLASASAILGLGYLRPDNRT